MCQVVLEFPLNLFASIRSEVFRGQIPLVVLLIEREKVRDRKFADSTLSSGRSL